MRYLLINILFLSLVSCASLPTTKNLEVTSINKTIENAYFSNIALDYVYKAKINVNNNNIGGLLIIKKINKNHHRVVFTTEFGNKIFDFEFDNNTFKVNSIIEQLKNKIVINALKKDFNLLINQFNKATKKFNNNTYYIYQTNLNKKDNYYFINKITKKLDKIVMASKHKEKVTIIFNKKENNTAKNIQIKHHNFNMNMQLNYLN